MFAHDPLNSDFVLLSAVAADGRLAADRSPLLSSGRWYAFTADAGGYLGCDAFAYVRLPMVLIPFWPSL